MERLSNIDLICIWVTFIEELVSYSDKAVSMVSIVDDENPSIRTFKIKRRPPLGLSYATALAEKYGLTPVSIQNYENLEETLAQLKQDGVEAFVGSCCEPFYAKHRDDFERIGLPGILVDVDSSTCYDLGKEQDAYAGQFENQTYLKLDLLERVVARVAPASPQAEDT